MKRSILTENYQRLFNDFDVNNPEKWKKFFGQFQWTIASIIFESSAEFHELAIEDKNFEMPPCLRLLGYYKASQEEPTNLIYLEKLKETMELYYAPEASTKHLPKIENRIRNLKKDNSL